jgi:centromere/kinetochore protein ZW10
LKNLATVLDFLDVHLFSALPPSHVASFKKTLCKPVTTALLQQFLVSLLPSSLTALPPYLHLVTQAKKLEETYIIGMLGQDPRDCEIKSWTDAVSSHYERRRRTQILEDARQMILRQDDGSQVLVEVDSPTPQPSSAPATQSSGSGSEGAGDVSDDAWGLEGEEGMDTDDVVSAAEEEDAWGFDDVPAGPEPEKLGNPPIPKDTLMKSEPATDDSAWGWDDGGEEANPPVTTSPPASSDNSADWDDDPWGDSSNPPPLPSTPASAPKPASRLGKLASKAKPKVTQPHSPPSFTDPHTVAARPPPKSVPQAETYVISGRARQLADTVDAILHEGEEFASTAIFDSSESTAHQTRGSVILQTAPAVLDLFRALYPVKFSQQPTEPKSIVFANDCIYTRGRVLSAAGQCVAGAKDRLLETAVSLETTGKRWYEQSIVGVLILIFCCAPTNDLSQETQQDLVADTLKKAEGFVGTAEQEHYDECEEAVMSVLSQVRKVARQWKVNNLVSFRTIV